MDDLVWIPLRALIDAQAETIRVHGGAPGVATRGLLESAAERARSKFAYAAEDQTIATLAAAYGYGLCRNHAFVDGNKRIAFIAVFMFLALNGWYLDAPEQDATEMMLAVASGQAAEAELAAWITRWARPEA